jgi:hypothetical protein
MLTGRGKPRANSAGLMKSPCHARLAYGVDFVTIRASQISGSKIRDEREARRHHSRVAAIPSLSPIAKQLPYYVIDEHALHERVLLMMFEKFRARGTCQWEISLNSKNLLDLSNAGTK